MLLALYADIKNLVAIVSSMSQGTLHIHLGLVLFFGGAKLLSGCRRYIRSWQWLLVICMLNEVLDLSYAYAGGDELDWSDTLGDIVNTMIWPTVLLLIWQPSGEGGLTRYWVSSIRRKS